MNPLEMCFQVVLEFEFWVTNKTNEHSPSMGLHVEPKACWAQTSFTTQRATKRHEVAMVMRYMFLKVMHKHLLMTVLTIHQHRCCRWWHCRVTGNMAEAIVEVLHSFVWWMVQCTWKDLFSCPWTGVFLMPIILLISSTMFHFWNKYEIPCQDLGSA